MLVPVTAACISAAALAFGVSEPSVWAILKTESGQVGSCTTQTNGAHDCGPAQINAEIWVPELARLMRRPTKDILGGLRDNGCFNVYVAAYILRMKVADAGGNVWDGMGRYHSATPRLKRHYQAKLAEAYRLLFPNLPGAPTTGSAAAEP